MENYPRTPFFTLKEGEARPTPEKETPRHDIPNSLSAGLGKILNDETPLFAAVTDAGWKAVASLPGLAVKVFLWGCVNAKPLPGGEVEFRLYKHQMRAVAAAIGDKTPEQSIINGLASLIRAKVVRRLSPGVLRFNTRYVFIPGASKK